VTDSKSILIVGASRGLGKGLAERYVEGGWSVLGTVRDAKAAALDGAETATVDINDDAAVKALHDKTAGKAFDVIFVVAGAATSWGPIHETDPEDALSVYRTNAVSPIRFAEAFIDRLAEGGQMVFMTSRMGSIAENESGGVDAYRASKAALNMLAKGFSLRHKGMTVTLMHPGWVKTDMGGAGAPIDVATSTKGIVEQIDQRAGAGDLAYVDYTGRQIPW
jgi:NAD(P)-dependent dehydrogenase (short-subunit alcohol dehydrogenase family)